MSSVRRANGEEFTNFTYSKDKDDIDWTSSGVQATPWFPIDGMVTCLVASNSAVVGFETSTPGLRGQSGGPAFDSDGKIWGVQSQTMHLHLGFDVEQDVFIKGKKQTAKDHASLHVGRCVHVERIKDFLRLHKVNFLES